MVKNFKIGQHLAKLWCPVFWLTG